MKTIIKLDNAVIRELITDSNDTLVHYHNLYCRVEHYDDDEIYYNDEEFFNTFFANDVIRAVQAACYGSYSYGHEYVQFNGYGNLESSSYPEDLVNIDSIIDSIIDHPEEYDIEIEEDEDSTI